MRAIVFLCFRKEHEVPALSTLCSTTCSACELALSPVYIDFVCITAVRLGCTPVDVDGDAGGDS